MGADIVVGEGQSIGVGLQFGGPYVGLFACKRNMSGRCRADCAAKPSMPNGKRGFVLTLSTREQHIRREKGDVEYLHQFRTLRAGLQHPHDLARGGRAAPAGRASTMPRPVAAPIG